MKSKILLLCPRFGGKKMMMMMTIKTKTMETQNKRFVCGEEK